MSRIRRKMEPTLNENKKKLICELRKDARKKLTDISGELKIPVSTLFDMLNDLENRKILKHKSIVRFEDIGYPFQIFLALKTEKNKRDSLKEFLKSQKNVNGIFQIGPDYDFFIDTIFRNYKEFQSFCENLETNNTLTEKNYFHVIDVIQKEKFLENIGHFE